jgi:hypothetical protein
MTEATGIEEREQDTGGQKTYPTRGKRYFETPEIYEVYRVFLPSTSASIAVVTQPHKVYFVTKSDDLLWWQCHQEQTQFILVEADF